MEETRKRRKRRRIRGGKEGENKENDEGSIEGGEEVRVEGEKKGRAKRGVREKRMGKRKER